MIPTPKKLVLPNTFLIGAQKAGTTSFYAWLSQHPDICAPLIAKDLHFFSTDRFYNKGLKFLSQYYLPFENEPVVVNAAVNYMFVPSAIERIHKFNSESKIILLLRNPINRAISAFKDSSRLSLEKRSFSQVIHDEQNNEFNSEDEAVLTSYLNHGMYVNQIENVYKYFNQNQVLILFFEKLMTDPESSMKKAFKFLEVDDSFVPQFVKINASKKPKYKWLNELFIGDSTFKRIIQKSRINKLIPHSLILKLTNYLRHSNVTSDKFEVVVSDDTKKELRNIFYADVKNLEALLNIKLESYWPEFSLEHSSSGS